MSFYNLMNGVNQSTFFVYPVLFDQHPDSLPRFRDCFVVKTDPNLDKYEIHIYTRVGGNNRKAGYGEEVYQQHKNFIRDFDNPNDSTYATYVFSIPDEFKDDIKLLMMGQIENVSIDYKDRLISVYPKLEEQFRKLFNYPKPDEEVK